jgi:hypothetical protein
MHRGQCGGSYPIHRHDLDPAPAPTLEVCNKIAGVIDGNAQHVSPLRVPLVRDAELFDGREKPLATDGCGILRPDLWS